MNPDKTSTKEHLLDTFPASGTAVAATGTNSAEPPAETANRVGIERAFDVIRHHTVHTKGYVLTALKLIEEVGTASEKALLAELLRKDGAATRIEPSQASSEKKKATRKK